MSFILPSPSTSAPSPSVNTPASSAARQGEPGQNDAGSFGETLARSLEPAQEASDKSPTKATTPSTEQQAADDKKTDADDLVNLMVLALPPRDPVAARGISPGSAVAASAHAAPAVDAAALTELLDNAAGTAAVVAPSLEVATDAAVTDDLGLVAAAISTGQKEGAQGAVKTPLVAADGSPALPTNLAAVASSSSAADTGSSGQHTQRDADSRQVLGEATEAGPAIADAQNSAKAPAGNAVPAAAVAVPVAGVTASSAPQLEPAANTPANGISPVATISAAVQSSAAAAAPDALPPATAAIAPEVGSSAWGKALGQQVIHLGTTGQQVAELQLNPPGLGPLKVSLSMNEQQMQAMFVSAHASVRAAIEAALPQLRSTLADSGISLGHTSVGAESQQQTAFSEQQDRQPARSFRGDSPAASPASPGRPVAEVVHPRGGSGVDTYA